MHDWAASVSEPNSISLTWTFGSMIRRAICEAANAYKNAVYGRGGEPYRINGFTIHYSPETRPTKPKYATSKNNVVRYDAIQARLFSEQISPGDTLIDVVAHAG